MKMIVTGPGNQKFEVPILEGAEFDAEKQRIGNMTGPPRIWSKERGFWPKPPTHETWNAEFQDDIVEEALAQKTDTMQAEGEAGQAFGEGETKQPAVEQSDETEQAGDDAGERTTET